MFIAMASIPLAICLIALFSYASYSEGKQMKNGAQLYANQEPKLK